MQLAPRLSSSPTPPASPFAAILQPGRSVVTHARPLLPGIEGALQRLADLGPFEHAARLDGGDPDPSALLESVSDTVARDFLTSDIAALTTQFAATLGRRHVHARLSVVRTDGCRKLHADNVTIRLLCTYAGPGTEWVADADVARENLARRDVDVETANRSVLRREDAIRRCDVGEVILLKGDAYEGHRGLGAVHRSPPIEARGLSRVLLKLDEHPCGC